MINIIIYLAITFLFFLWFRKEKEGGWFGMGLVAIANMVIIIIWLVFTLIWGGIFWW